MMEWKRSNGVSLLTGERIAFFELVPRPAEHVAVRRAMELSTLRRIMFPEVRRDVHPHP